MCYSHHLQSREKCDDDFQLNLLVSCHWNKKFTFGNLYFCHLKARIAYPAVSYFGDSHYASADGLPKCHRIENCNPDYTNWKDGNNQTCSSYNWNRCRNAQDLENIGWSGLNCPECQCRIN